MYRGFFRLWIVMSLVWIAIIVAGLGTEEFKGLWRSHVELQVEYKGGTKDVLDSSRSKEDLRQRIGDAVRRDAAELQRSDQAEARRQIESLNANIDELLKAMDDENQKRADRLHRALMVALAPPLALLIAGLAVAWIASGFRRTA
ncbi:hypothetical protein [Bradyrhizobium sp. McL0616]|uniref:hypothetical protein n=1 Tax=Bradyrhizobium sp. McL0616 TaxID=3415674 RepID=UPI003CEC4A97